jgi:hypothetical protein
MPNTVTVTGQVNQATQAQTTAGNLGQMVGRVAHWNYDAPITEIRKWINDSYRDIINSRSWNGLKIRGQLTVPNIYSTGTVTLTLGSQTVVGTGTAWDSSFIGRQIRAGFSTGFYNISAVADPTHLTIDLPWGNPTLTNTGYTIMQPWVSLGYNIKRILTMVNQRQGWRMVTDYPQRILNQQDTWRTSMGWSWAVSPKEPTSAGEPQFEIYPAPTFQQVFPYQAYIQPPDMVNDVDFPVPWIPTDVLILPAIANVLTVGGPKKNQYYDPTTAGAKLKEFSAKMQGVINADDALDPKDYRFGDGLPVAPMGATFWQNHDEGGW